MTFSWLAAEREAGGKLLSFIRNPIGFYAKNKEKKKSLLSLLSFIIRLSAIIDFIITVLFQQKSWLYAIIKLAILLLFAPLIASIVLAVKAGIINLTAKQLFKHNNLTAAQRAVAYASVTAILPSFPFSSAIKLLLFVLLETIGIAKQYRLTAFRSLLVAVVPLVVIALALLVLIFLGMALN